MKFSLTILGSGAAVPTKKRNPTSQLLNIRNKLILIDCGEGTQLQLTRFGIPIQKISHIFISHMHGDHYYGLPGLLSKFQLLGRERKLDLYGPPGVKEVLEVNFRYSNTKLAYPLDFHSLDFEAGREICSNEQFTVSTIPLLHSVPTNGFLFREQPLKRNIRKDFVRKYKIPVPEFENIKSGEDYVDEKGKVHFNEDITHSPAKPRSYAYCTDTAYSESIPGLIKGSDLLYHEATFDEKLKDTAHKKLHATAKQAAEIAKRAEAKKLLIGHFSARYKEVDLLVRQAREIFPETYAAEDGETYEV